MGCHIKSLLIPRNWRIKMGHFTPLKIENGTFLISKGAVPVRI